ncbi:MAG: hypothetical protein GY733_08110, partial [bacterium]|nr:hypothetical protein [bacterium]
MVINVELPSDRFRFEIAARGLASLALGQQASRLSERVDEWRAATGVETPRETIIPMKLHADGVAVTNRRKLFVIDFSCVLGETASSRHTFAVISSANMCQCGCRGFHSLQALFRVLVWDLDLCARGEPPRRRHDNTSLGESEKWRRELLEMPRVAMMYVTGDWEWLTQCFHFRTWASASFCFRCEATLADGALSYKNTGAAAGWRDTRFASTASVLNRIRREGIETSELLRVPGFTWSHVAIDVLHTWCLGVSQVIAGSFIVEWCREQGLPSVSRALAIFNNRYGAFARRARRADPSFSQAPPLTHYTIMPRGAFAGQLACKGAETRGIVTFIEVLSAESVRNAPGDEHRELRHTCVTSLAAFYRSMQADPYSPDVVRNATRSCLVAFSAVHASAHRDGMPEPRVWHYIPKLHLAQEIGEYQSRELGNPREWWCYRDEGFMGEVKRICLNTRHPRTLAAIIITICTAKLLYSVICSVCKRNRAHIEDYGGRGAEEARGVRVCRVGMKGGVARTAICVSSSRPSRDVRISHKIASRTLLLTTTTNYHYYFFCYYVGWLDYICFSTLTACWQHVGNTLATSWQQVANLLPTCCQPAAKPVA